MASGSTSSPLRFGERVTHAHWNTDSFADECSYPTCHKSFTLVERRHHCRVCGSIFCEEHSSFKRPLNQTANYDAKGEWVRVCLACYSLLPVPKTMSNDQKAEEELAMKRFERLMIDDQRAEASGPRRGGRNSNFKSVLQHMSGSKYTGSWQHIHRTDGSQSIFELSDGTTIRGRWSQKKRGNSAIFMGQFYGKDGARSGPSEPALFCGQPFSVKWERAVEALDWTMIRESLISLQEARDYHQQCLSANSFHTLYLSRERARSDMSDLVDYTEVLSSADVHHAARQASEAPMPTSQLHQAGTDAAGPPPASPAPPSPLRREKTDSVASYASTGSLTSSLGPDAFTAEALESLKTFCEVLRLYLEDTSNPLGKLIADFACSVSTPPPELASFLSRTVRDLHLRMVLQDANDFISSLEKCILESCRTILTFPIKDGAFLRLLHEVVMPLVYPKLFMFYRNKYRARDSKLDAKIRHLMHITPAHCLNKKEFHLPDEVCPYSTAIDVMRQFQHATYPLEKLKVLVDTAQAIASHLIQVKGVTSIDQVPGWGADTSWPLFQYVLIKAQLPYLYSELQFLLDFSSRRLIADDDSLSYRLMVFEATIDLIWALEPALERGEDGVLLTRRRDGPELDEVVSRLASIPINVITGEDGT